MFPRPFPLLVTAIPALLIFTAGALTGCGHNAAVIQTPQPSATSASGDQDRVDWSSFTLYEHAGLHGSSLHEVSVEAGFPFVLPSYLPSTIKHTLFLSSQLEPSAKGQGWVLVNFGSSPSIKMTEYPRPSDSPRVTSYGDEFDVRTVAGILVGCLPETPNQTWPTPVPDQSYPAELTCRYETEDLSFLVQFMWQVNAGTPSQATSEQRGEAWKVVTSMIEDPYTP